MMGRPLGRFLAREREMRAPKARRRCSRARRTILSGNLARRRRGSRSRSARLGSAWELCFEERAREQHNKVSFAKLSNKLLLFLSAAREFIDIELY